MCIFQQNSPPPEEDVIHNSELNQEFVEGQFDDSKYVEEEELMSQNYFGENVQIAEVF